MKSIFVFLFAALFACSVSAKTWNGYLMDKMCAKRKAGDMQKMTAHTKMCLTEESCATTGYGVIVGKKFIPFDKKGNQITADYLKSASKDKDFKIEVTGTMKKNTIAVSSIKW